MVYNTISGINGMAKKEEFVSKNKIIPDLIKNININDKVNEVLNNLGMKSMMKEEKEEFGSDDKKFYEETWFLVLMILAMALIVYTSTKVRKS
tara:strand:- start:172 stop:450 length:279 start_codon:yes stop_codon:yes gene_type:complete